MLTLVGNGPEKYIPVGVLIIFLFLLIYTLLIFICRLSAKVNSTVVFTLAVAVSGVINGACLLYLSVTPFYYSSRGNSIPNFNVQIAIVLFGLALAPLIWMSGISVFTAIIGKDIQVKLGYLLTLIELALIIVCTVFSGMNISYYSVVNYVYWPLSITILALRWLYFLLFFVLVIRHRNQLTRCGKIVLIAFGVLNTIVLIVETAFLNVLDSGLTYSAYIMIRFFLTDFLSTASMVLIITFYRSMTTKNEYMYDN